MISRRRRFFSTAALALPVAALAACNPYQNFSGEFYAGPIDATNFAAPYQGVLPGTPDQGGGVINASLATVDGKHILYYLFPFGDNQNAQSDPLAINTDAAPAPKAAVFDPTMTSAFPDPSMCVAPKNYVYDQRTDAYRLDEQGVIFDSIPSDPGYTPVIQESPVVSNGEKCQAIKSKQTLLNNRKDVMTTDAADGKYLAFAEIDPSADVRPNLPTTGQGPIHVGWYNKYSVPFIDGGYIPTEDVPGANGMTTGYTRLHPQTLYAPTLIPGVDGSMNAAPVGGGVGTGYDILTAERGKTGYSPVCHVILYTPDDPLHPKTSVSDLSPAELITAGSASADGGYIFCLQTQP